MRIVGGGGPDYDYDWNEDGWCYDSEGELTRSPSAQEEFLQLFHNLPDLRYKHGFLSEL